MMKLNIQLFAHKKGGGSTCNGRDSAGRRLGAKIADGQTAKAGNIFIVKEEQEFIQEQMLVWEMTTHYLLKKMV